MLSNKTISEWPNKNAVFSVNGKEIRGRKNAVKLLKKGQNTVKAWDSKTRSWIILPYEYIPS